MHSLSDTGIQIRKKNIRKNDSVSCYTLLSGFHGPCPAVLRNQHLLWYLMNYDFVTLIPQRQSCLPKFAYTFFFTPNTYRGR